MIEANMPPISTVNTCFSTSMQEKRTLDCDPYQHNGTPSLPHRQHDHVRLDVAGISRDRSN